MNNIPIVLPALIALLGTLITIIIGYRQWRRQHDVSQFQKFQDDRRDAHKRLWEMLENVHIKIREDQINNSQFNELLKGVNSFILRNSLYIEKDDSILAGEYLDSLFKVSHLVLKTKDKNLKEDWGVLEILFLMENSMNLNLLLKFRKILETRLFLGFVKFFYTQYDNNYF